MVRKDLMWVPAKRKADRVASATPSERIEAAKVRVADCRRFIESLWVFVQPHNLIMMLRLVVQQQSDL